MKFKKLVSLVLSAAMIISMPTMAFADVAKGEVTADEAVTALDGSSIMTEDMREQKQKLFDHHVLSDVKAMKEGVDYEEGTVIMWTKSKEVVEYTAKKYDADIERYRNKVAVLKLRSMSVEEAIALACDPENDYPAVSVNRYHKIEPEPKVEEGASLMESATTKNTWYSYVSGLSNADPGLKNPSANGYQWHHDMMNSYAAWGITKGDPACKVAVIDSGFDDTNADLAEMTVDDMGFGANYPEINEDTIEGSFNHGTNVAGIIGAKQNNGQYGSGVAPDVTMIGYRIMNDEGRLVHEALLESITKAADEGAWLINMSLGGPYFDPAEDEACEYAKEKGVAIFASIGNEATNIRSYPGAFDSVFAVQACDKDGSLASFSNYGKCGDLTAPGVKIWSTDIIDDDGNPAAYHYMSGTSQASPNAAGVAALYLSALYEKQGRTDGKSPISPDELIAAMKKATTNGVIDAAKLLQVGIDAPKLALYDSEDQEITGTSLTSTESGYVKLDSNDVNTDMMVYTLDGTNPVVSNGEIKGTGVKVEADAVVIPLSEYGDIGSTLTVKAIAINGMGVCSAISTIKVKVVAESDVITPPGEGVGLVKTITLSTAKSVSLKSYSDDPKDTYQIEPVFKDASGNVIDPSDVDYKFTTNKKAIATVSESGLVTALRPGKAVIKCKALDGSNVEKALNITVVPGINGVEIKGQLSVAAGATAKYTAVASADGKAKVTSTDWSLPSPVEGVSIDAKKGVVKVAATVADGTTFDIHVVISDGIKEQTDTKTIQVAKKATKVTLALAGDFDGLSTLYGEGHGDYDHLNPVVKKGSLSQITLYSSSIVDPAGIMRCTNQTRLAANVEENGTDIVWSSNKPNVVSVESDGILTAHGSGVAVITAATQDGSGKKASVKVNVITPASYIRILSHTKNASHSFDWDYLKIGGSIKLTAEIGNTYGKLPGKKVKWDFMIGSREEADGGYLRDVELENMLRRTGLVTLKNGTLTIKPGASRYVRTGSEIIKVHATTTDGTDLEALFTIRPVSNASDKIYLVFNGNLYENGFARMAPDYDVFIPLVGFVRYPNLADYGAFHVDSSNPEIASAEIIKSDGVFGVLIVGGIKEGTAKVTITATDGGKGKAVVTVYNYWANAD